MKCSICHQPVALETANTDEAGQAVHEECYLLNLGIEADPDLSTGSRIQSVNHGPDNQNATAPFMKGLL